MLASHTFQTRKSLYDTKVVKIWFFSPSLALSDCKIHLKSLKRLDYRPPTLISENCLFDLAW